MRGLNDVINVLFPTAQCVRPNKPNNINIIKWINQVLEEVKLIIPYLTVYQKKGNMWLFLNPNSDEQAREVPTMWLREFTFQYVGRLMEPHPLQLAMVWSRTGWMDEEEAILPLVDEDRAVKSKAKNNMMLSYEVRALQEDSRITRATSSQYGEPFQTLTSQVVKYYTTIRVKQEPETRVQQPTSTGEVEEFELVRPMTPNEVETENVVPSVDVTAMFKIIADNFGAQGASPSIPLRSSAQEVEELTQWTTPNESSMDVLEDDELEVWTFKLAPIYPDFGAYRTLAGSELYIWTYGCYILAVWSNGNADGSYCTDI